MQFNVEDLDMPMKRLFGLLSDKSNIHEERFRLIDDELEEVNIELNKEIEVKIIDDYLYLINFEQIENLEVNYNIVKRIGDDEKIFSSKIEPNNSLFFENCFTFKYKIVPKNEFENIIKKIKIRKFTINDLVNKDTKNPQFYEDIRNIKENNGIFILKSGEFISETLCDKLIDFYQEFPIKKTQVWNDDNNNVNCNLFSISSPPNTEDKYYLKKAKKLDDEVFSTIGKVVNYLSYTYGIRGGLDSGYALRKIYGPTNKHTDGLVCHRKGKSLPIDSIRNYSLIIALNDDYEGGEFYFPYQKFTYKLKKGEIIIFPPYWTHPHLTYPLKNRTYRYTINTWLFEDVSKILENENKKENENDNDNENRNIEKTNDKPT